MADTNPIKVFKGDDTDFNGVFTLDKFKVTKSAASKSIVLS